MEGPNMDFAQIFRGISAGLLVTDENFKVIWANDFEYQRYKKELLGLYVVDCHQEKNREKIKEFLEKFRTGELKEFTKSAHGMVITYSSYFRDGKFAGIVRTRIPLPR